jgi:hypothetical protein
MTVETKSTVNALVYTVAVRWGEPIPTQQAVMVWNLFQKWAGKNGTTLSGRVSFLIENHPLSKKELLKGFETEAHLRERLGHPKNKHP